MQGTWGRPQRDGPALRATALMKFAGSLVARKQTQMVKDIYWPIILNDLRYVGQYWNQSGFELWEEVHGSSFFTLLAMHRALVEGAVLAEKLGVECPACNQSAQILCFAQNNFWNETGGYITADVNPNVNRSGVNVSPLLASIHVFDINATCNASGRQDTRSFGPSANRADYQPCNSQILATHKVVVDAFREIYAINGNKTAPDAVLVGRYPEDSYYGGNPWPLCTLGCAEVLYDAVAQFEKAGEIAIDDTSLAFFQDIYPDAEATTYTGDAMSNITQAMTTYADGFVSAVEVSVSCRRLRYSTDRK
jgi:glucoamylase